MRTGQLVAPGISCTMTAFPFGWIDLGIAMLTCEVSSFREPFPREDERYRSLEFKDLLMVGVQTTIQEVPHVSPIIFRRIPKTSQAFWGGCSAPGSNLYHYSCFQLKDLWPVGKLRISNPGSPSRPSDRVS